MNTLVKLATEIQSKVSRKTLENSGRPADVPVYLISNRQRAEARRIMRRDSSDRFNAPLWALQIVDKAQTLPWIAA